MRPASTSAGFGWELGGNFARSGPGRLGPPHRYDPAAGRRTVTIPQRAAEASVRAGAVGRRLGSDLDESSLQECSLGTIRGELQRAPVGDRRL